MKSRPREIITRVIVFLLLVTGGAIVNVAVAWGCAYWSVDAELYDYRCDPFQPPRVSESERAWLTQFESRYVEERQGDWSYGDLVAFGLFKRDYFNLPERMFTPASGGGGSGAYAELVSSTCAGWPVLSMHSYDLHVDLITAWDREYVDAIIVHRNVDIGGPISLRRPLPLRPMFPGFAINTIFYAGILWLLFFAPGNVRRAIRRRRGLCPACAYPVGNSPVCTECGKAVTPKSVEPA